MTGKTDRKASSAQKLSKTGAPKSPDGKPAALAPDWEKLEAQYRIGLMSLREMASEHGITEGAIRKRAKRDEWSRDLKAKVKAKADALVRKELVRNEVRKESATEKETIEVEATVQARIRLNHRTDIGKSRSLAMKLLAELQDQTENNDLYEQLGELLIESPDDQDNSAAQERQRKRLEVFRAAMSLPGRSKVMKEMADTLKTLIGLEREAFGLNSDLKPTGDGFFESTLDLIRSE